MYLSDIAIQGIFSLAFLDLCAGFLFVGLLVFGEWEKQQQ